MSYEASATRIINKVMREWRPVFVYAKDGVVRAQTRPEPMFEAALLGVYDCSAKSQYVNGVSHLDKWITDDLIYADEMDKAAH